MSIRSKLVDFITNDHIQTATVSGLCIIALAFVFKRVLHVEGTNFESALPGFVFTAFAVAKVKSKKPILTRPLLWNIIAIAVTGLVILRRVYF
ncbi:MAG: hypothetical protein AB1483_05410 [Candidatus Zixiibacteriota bacterium]